MRTKRIVFLIIILILSVIFMSACGGPGAYMNRSNGKVWIVDDSGGVQTNDLVRLQNATPFKIVIPNYLPAEVLNAPVMYLKAVGTYSKNDVDIQFAYWNSPEGITIEEVNDPIQLLPSTANGGSYIQIKGISVLQMTLQEVDDNTTVNVYEYQWYQNGVSFIVDGWACEQEESKMVAESMIK